MNTLRNRAIKCNMNYKRVNDVIKKKPDSHLRLNAVQFFYIRHIHVFEWYEFQNTKLKCVLSKYKVIDVQLHRNLRLLVIITNHRMCTDLDIMQTKNDFFF